MKYFFLCFNFWQSLMPFPMGLTLAFKTYVYVHLTLLTVHLISV